MKDPLASRPFDEADIGYVLQAADARTIHWREDNRDDTTWMGRYARFSLTFGPQVSVLSGGWRRRTDKGSGVIKWRFSDPLTSGDLRIEGGEFYLAWRRPKTETPILAPVPDSMKAWLGRWLDSYRPTRRSRYWELLKGLEATMEHPVLLTPTRFRHTAATLQRRAGMIDEDIQQLIGIAPQTMKHYINRSLKDMTKSLRESGLLR